MRNIESAIPTECGVYVDAYICTYVMNSHAWDTIFSASILYTGTSKIQNIDVGLM